MKVQSLPSLLVLTIISTPKLQKNIYLCSLFLSPFSILHSLCSLFFILCFLFLLSQVMSYSLLLIKTPLPSFFCKKNAFFMSKPLAEWKKCCTFAAANGESVSLRVFPRPFADGFQGGSGNGIKFFCPKILSNGKFAVPLHSLRSGNGLPLRCQERQRGRS